MQEVELIHRVQGMMVYLCSLANGLEQLAGRGSEGICFRAGRRVGLDWKVEHKEADLLKGIDAVQAEMRRMNINWPLRAYKKAAEQNVKVETEKFIEIRLAIENCIVRCSLARYGFKQKGSVCNTKHGLFCGLFDQICGTRSAMDIIHAGEAGCLLKLKIAR